MNSELLGLVLLLELVLAISTSAPLTLSGKFTKHPNLGIAIWFVLLMVSLVAALAAVLIAFSSVFQSYFSLQAGQDLGEILLISFAPWILLAFAGVFSLLQISVSLPTFKPENGTSISISYPSPQAYCLRGYHCVS